jgi:cathepsin L
VALLCSPAPPAAGTATTSLTAHSHPHQGVNQFTDRTDAELARLRGVRGARRVAPQAATPAPPRKAFAAAAGGELLPAAVDWRAKGVVTAVKNQGGCGSCWAFAATEAVESAFALATGRLEVLSEQQVLDCTPNPLECGGDGGCAGGTPELAFARMAELGGLASEWQYPYMSFTGQGVGPCRAAANATGGAPPLAEVTGFVQLPSNKAEPVLQALAEHGPLAVNVDASAWFAYESGVFTGCAKATEDIDHAVVVVGYGTDAATGLDYYLVRNSWSTAWGEAGYMRLLRQPGAPRCASDVTPFDGSDCRDVPDPVTTVTVCGECGILYDVSFPLVNVKAL